MTVPEVLNLLDYDRWATEAQMTVVAGLSTEQYEKDLGASHGGIRGTLVHIYGAQRIWLSRWKGKSPTGLISVSEVPTLDELRRLWPELRAQIQQFVTPLSEDALNARLPYMDIRGMPQHQPLSHQISHVMNHSTYHRGQITTMLRQFGVRPPVSIDLISYYRELDANLEQTRVMEAGGERS